MSDIPAQDLKFELWPPRQKGGQHVGAPSGVRVTHLPSGIEATVDIGLSQYRHKAIAMDMILAAITHPEYRP